MKTFIFILFFMLSGFNSVQVYGQTNTPAKRTSTTKSSAKKTYSAPKPITITVKNADEKDLMIFAGAKADIKKPKPKEKALGGLSTNTLYLKTGDVVCIMDSKGKTLSCANIKAGMTTVEINAAGTVITGK